jgi:molybdate transport system substrate-binding protein
MRNIVSAIVLLSFCATVDAAEVRVLSAGAVEPGVHAFAEVVKRETPHELKVQFNSAPQIEKRLAAGEVYDILITTPAAMKQAIEDGKVIADTRMPLGRVGAGIVVRAGAAAPNVSTVDDLKQALLAADSVVYNTASSGIYLDKLFAKVGVLDQIKPKTTRYADAGAVMAHVIKGKGNEIGFGPITEIRMYEPKGLRMIAPLPADVQNYTSYEAAVMVGAPGADPARGVLRLVATRAGKTAFTSRGVE